MIGKIQNADIRLLRVFRAVARCGGFTAAQVELNTSQSTISTHMARLEQRLSVRLCERGQSGFRLTQDGKVVLNAMEKLFASLEDFRNSVSECAAVLQGELRFGLNDIMITNPKCGLPAAIREFTEEAPQVRVDLFVGETSELETRLLGGRLHLAVGIFHHRVQTLDYQPLFTEEQVLYCGRNHSLFSMDEDGLSVEAIQAADYASWGYLESLESLRPKFGLQPTVGTPYMEGLAMMVCSGRFIAYLPTHFADRWVKSGDMRALLPRKTGRVVDVHLVTHKGDSHSRIVELFKQRIAARSQADATHPYAAALASA